MKNGITVNRLRELVEQAPRPTLVGVKPIGTPVVKIVAGQVGVVTWEYRARGPGGCFASPLKACFSVDEFSTDEKEVIAGIAARIEEAGARQGYVFDDEIIRLAADLGMSESDARSFSTVESLERALEQLAERPEIAVPEFRTLHRRDILRRVAAVIGGLLWAGGIWIYASLV